MANSVVFWGPASADAAERHRRSYRALIASHMLMKSSIA